MKVRDPRCLDGLLDSIRREPDYFPAQGEEELLSWLARAAAIGRHSVTCIAILIRKLAVASGYKTFIMIRPEDVEEAGMKRTASFEALKRLEAAGLVTVNRCQGKSPQVSIVQADTGEIGSDACDEHQT